MLSKKQQKDMAENRHKVFELCWYHYDSYNNYIMLGPESMTKVSFERLCDRLVPEATKRVLATRDDDSGWVGWQDIVEQLPGLLEEEGFLNISPVRHVYSGNGIIGHPFRRGKCYIEPVDRKLKQMLDEVIKHNKKVQKGLDARVRGAKT